jgi:hypothetical protein
MKSTSLPRLEHARDALLIQSDHIHSPSPSREVLQLKNCLGLVLLLASHLLLWLLEHYSCGTTCVLRRSMI